MHGADDDAIVSVGNPLLLRPREDDYASRHPGAQDTLLEIEVADSALRYDLKTKARV